MPWSVRPVAALVAVLLCLVAAPAFAQRGPTGPPLTDDPGFGTPTPTATATASATATATATPVTPDGKLAETGADPLRLALAGISLLGFGLCLRLRIAPADARPH